MRTPMLCPNLEPHFQHRWHGHVYWCAGRDGHAAPPVESTAGDHAEAAMLARNRLAAQYGASDTYPSRAAGYGAEALMAMAGTLAERAEQMLPMETPPGEPIAAAGQAQVGLAYAVLALTQAVRDLPEQITAALRALDAEE